MITIIATRGLKANKIPNEVATPFPPLKPRVTGKQCPIRIVNDIRYSSYIS